MSRQERTYCNELLANLEDIQLHVLTETLNDVHLQAVKEKRYPKKFLARISDDREPDNLLKFNSLFLSFSGEPLRLDMDIIIASFDSISEVNMVSKSFILFIMYDMRTTKMVDQTPI